MCICKTTQPSKLILEKDSFIEPENRLDEMRPEITIFADTECMIKDLVRRDDTEGGDEGDRERNVRGLDVEGSIIEKRNE